MAERFPDGNNPWQDGDVLTASDLNDTIDALGDGIDTIGEEAQENRLLINQIQFQTSADADGDSTNSFADIATDSDGYRNSISTTEFSHNDSGLNGFHYPIINNDFAVTQTNVSIGKSFISQGYDVVGDEVLIATDIKIGNNDTIDLDYEIYDTDGNQLRSNTIQLTDGSQPSDPYVNHGDYISEGVFALLWGYDVGTGESGYCTLIDTINNNVKSDIFIDSSGDTGTVDLKWLGSTHASSGNYGALSVYVNDNNDGHGTYNRITETSSGTNISEKDPFQQFYFVDGISGIYPGGSFVGSFIDTGDGEDTIVVSHSMGGVSDRSDIDANAGTIGLENNFAFYNYDGTDSLNLNLKNGDVSDLTTTKTKQDSIGQNLSAYNQTDDIYRVTNGHTYVEGFDDFNQGSNVGDFSTLPNTGSEFFVSYQGDGSLYKVAQNSQTVEIYKVENQTSVKFSANSNYEIDKVTHSDNIEYLNARFYTKGNDDINKVQVVDTSTNTDLGTFNTEEKIYIGDQNTSEIKLRLERAQVPSKSGIKAYSVITW